MKVYLTYHERILILVGFFTSYHPEFRVLVGGTTNGIAIGNDWSHFNRIGCRSNSSNCWPFVGG
jgi:hypothetical protein